MKNEYTFTFKCGNRIWWKFFIKLESSTIADNENYCWSIDLFGDDKKIISDYIYTNVQWVDKRDCAKWIQSYFGSLAITCAVDAVEYCN